jgi:two-component system nitrate/nitrite response regulator NarL
LLKNSSDIERKSILVADDHILIRDAVASALSVDQRFDVSTTDSFSSTQAEITRLGAVDILLLDIVMPGMHGLRSVDYFVKLNAGGAVVIFSGVATDDFVSKALALGARGFIPKTLPLRSLAATIHLISLGQVFVPATLEAPKEKLLAFQSEELSSKELKIINLVSDGMTNKAIAWEIGLSEVTIKMHMRAICLKLNAKNRAHAVLLAARFGLLKPVSSSS